MAAGFSCWLQVRPRRMSNCVFQVGKEGVLSMKKLPQYVVFYKWEKPPTTVTFFLWLLSRAFCSKWCNWNCLFPFLVFNRSSLEFAMSHVFIAFYSFFDSRSPLFQDYSLCWKNCHLRVQQKAQFTYSSALKILFQMLFDLKSVPSSIY